MGVGTSYLVAFFTLLLINGNLVLSLMTTALMGTIFVIVLGLLPLMGLTIGTGTVAGVLFIPGTLPAKKTIRVPTFGSFVCKN